MRILRVHGILTVCGPFCVWLLSLSVMSRRLRHVMACVTPAFLSVAEEESIVRLCLGLCIHPCFDGYLGCSHSPAVTNIAGTNICGRVFGALWCVPRSEAAGSYGNYLYPLELPPDYFLKPPQQRTFSPVAYDGSSFPTSLPTLVMVRLFDESRPSGREGSFAFPGR